MNYVVVHNNTTVENNTVINNITKNVTIINNITNNHVTNNVVYNRGPEVNEVENVSKVKVQHVIINENNKPGASSVNNNNLFVYRPVIKPNKETDAVKPIPQKVENYRPHTGN